MIPGIELDRTSGPQAVAWVATVGAMVVAACAWVAIAHRRAAPAPEVAAEASPAPAGGLDRRKAWTLLGLIVVLAFGLRLIGTGQSLSHPEMLVPGIDLPRRVSEPPGRLTWMDTVWLHLHGEVHPPGYFLGMFAWTRLFGTAAVTIRLPSVLAGTGTVLVGYALAAGLFGRAAALFAAALLALHGLGIHYSGIAQHYALGAFLAICSMALLWLVRARSRWLWPGAAGYFLVTWAGLSLQIYFWLFFATQFVWATLLPSGARRRVLRLVTLVAIVAMPMLAHSIYRGPELPVPRLSVLSLLGGWSEDLAPVSLIGARALSPSVVIDYLGFGFLFTGDGSSLPPRPVSPWWINAVLAPLLLVLVVAAWGRRLPPRGSPDQEPNVGLWLAAWLPASLGLVAWLSRLALRRQLEIRFLLLVGLALLAVPPLLDRLGHWLDVRVGRMIRPRLGVLLLGLASFGSFALVSVLAVNRNVLLPRLELLFVPPLLLLAAGGVGALAHRRAIAGLVSAALLCVFAASSVRALRIPSSVRDYKGLAAAMRPLEKPGDLLFVTRNYATTPLFYYLDPETVQPVLWRRARRLLGDPTLRRFWTVETGDAPEDPQPPAGFHLAASPSSRRMVAFLFVRDDPEAGG